MFNFIYIITIYLKYFGKLKYKYWIFTIITITTAI